MEQGKELYFLKIWRQRLFSFSLRRTSLLVKNTARILLIELKVYVGNTSKNETKIEKTLKIQLGKNEMYLERIAIFFLFFFCPLSTFSQFLFFWFCFCCQHKFSSSTTKLKKKKNNQDTFFKINYKFLWPGFG